MKRINSGRNEQLDETFRVNTFLSEVVPEDYTQSRTGQISPSLTSAKAAAYGYFIKNGLNPDIAEGFYQVFEEALIDKIDELNEKTEHVQFEIFTVTGLRRAFSDDIRADLALVQVAIMLVATYTILVLGTFSGLHCRLVVALMGLFCVGLAYAAGFGFSFYCGGETAGVHGLMPFLLIGIGVDDMFVICNAIDQTSLNDSPHQRIKNAMQHAGPSITITSLTNTLAFAFGGLNSLTSLRSFCLFAAASVMMLYLIVMSVFLCVCIWDTERVAKRRGDCCGLCMCKMDSIFCCKGACLSPKQKRFGTLEAGQTEPKPQAAEEINEDEEASKTEKCIAKYLAPNLLTNAGRITMLVIYAILIAGSIYGCL